MDEKENVASWKNGHDVLNTRKDSAALAGLAQGLMIWAERKDGISFDAYVVNNDTNIRCFLGRHTIPNGKSFGECVEKIRDGFVRTLGFPPLDE